LAAVCDIDPVRLAEHEQKYGVKGYSRLEDMLSNEKLDLIAVYAESGFIPIRRFSGPLRRQRRHRKADGYPLARRRAHGQGL
jgi:hypothetical protein